MPWWIDETTENVQLMPDILRLGLSNVTLMSDLSADVIDYLVTAIFILFPEVLGISTTKFKSPAQWLCARHSIVSPCLRDSFSAGGQVNIIVDGDIVYHNAPKMLGNFIKHIGAIRKIFQSKSDAYEEIPTYASYKGDNRDPYDAWVSAVDTYLSKTIDTTILSTEEISKMEFVEENKDGLVVRAI